MKKRLAVLLSLCALLLLPALVSAGTQETTPSSQVVAPSCAVNPILASTDPTPQAGNCATNRSECNAYCWMLGCTVSYFYCDRYDPWNYICECTC